jgi:transcription elongation factor Elf1
MTKRKRLPAGVIAQAKPGGSELEWIVMCPGCGELVPADLMMSTPGRLGYAMCEQCWAELEAETTRPVDVGPKYAALCALVPVAP